MIKILDELTKKISKIRTGGSSCSITSTKLLFDTEFIL